MNEYGLVISGNTKYGKINSRKTDILYFGSSEGCAVRAFDTRQDGDYLCFRVEAGRLSYLAGRMQKRRYADPSSPLAGLI